MTALYICDDGEVNGAVEICRSGGWAIEVQAGRTGHVDPAAA